MADNIDPTARADSALALELVARFFGNQIDAGAVLREEIARHIMACAEAVALRQPESAPHLDTRAAAMIAQLPAGWAEGDEEWHEPA